MLDFNQKEILITGGAGFFGSYLTEEMLKQGARVTLFDRFYRGKGRIQHILDHPNLTIVEADLADYAKMVEAVRGKYLIWHLAGNTDIPAGLKDTGLDFKDGLAGTRNVLEAMRETGVKKLVFPSSGAIYGEKTSGFRSESHGPTLPISLYGAGKLACEAFISAYSHLFDIQAWIFRYGNIISGRISHSVILDFICKLRANPRELEVLGDGTQTKSYLLAEECIDGMLYVISKTRPRGDEGYCDVFNLGAPDETLVLDIATIIQEEMGIKDCKIKLKGGERGWRGDQAKIALDGAKIRALGWQPKHSSAEAVRISVKRMLEQKDFYLTPDAPPKKVAVVGLWHLGLVTAACLAEQGCNVSAYDENGRIVTGLQQGKPPLFEPGLEAVIQSGMASGKLRFETSAAKAVAGAKTVFLTYDTPVDADDHTDLSILERALDAIIPSLDPEALLVINSQVPVRTTEKWQDRILAARPDSSIDVIYSPENLRLGQAIENFKRPDMIILGVNSERARKKAGDVFESFLAEKFFVSRRTAEMAKHALNGFFATSISFANEFGRLCDGVGADGIEISKILKKDSRIGKKAQVRPGLGFAGATLARDLRALQKLGRDLQVQTPLLDDVLEINRRQTGRVIQMLEEAFDGNLKGRQVTVLGLTYKPGTSTLRRSASLEIIDGLLAQGAQVRAHDPKADLSEYPGTIPFEFCADPYRAVEGSEALLVMTEWPEYRALDYGKIFKAMRRPLILDAKNHLDPAKMRLAGFTHLEIGRGQLATVKA